MVEQKQQFSENRRVILVGILGSLVSIPAYILPGLSIINMLLPIPYILVFSRYGHQKGTRAILITAVLNGLVLGMIGIVWTLIGFGLISVFIGGAFREKWSPTKTAVAAVFATVSSQLLQYYIQYLFFPEALQKFAESLIPYWERSLAGLEIIPTQEINQTILELLPAAKVASAVGLGLLYYYLTAYVFRRLGIEVERLKPLREWSFPRIVGLLAMLGWLLTLMEVLPINAWVITILTLLSTLLVLQGAALLAFILDRIGLYSLIRNILLALVVAFVWPIVLMIGLIDNTVGFRRLFRKKKVV